MKRLAGYLVLVSWLSTLVHCQCVRQDWTSSFNQEGLSFCSSDRLINGFYRNNREGNDNILLLEEAECCDMTLHWDGYGKQTMNANWGNIFDANYRWVYCPSGYFLEGLYRSENTPGWLHNIEEGRCSKSRDHPNYHGHCYDQDISQCFHNKTLCKCNVGYFVTGLYRGGCDALYCLEKLRCCKMASNVEPLDEMSKVKTRIMDMSMSFMALLAHFLGYGWCSGCKAQYVGEDFYRSGDSWIADKSRRCSGYKSDHRLSMVYGDWGYHLKDITFGKSIIENLLPETADSGTIYNNDTSEAIKTVSRSVTSVRTVKHTVTSNWKVALEFKIKIPFRTGTASFGVSYENSVTKVDTTGTEDSKTFQISTTKTLAANSSISWRLLTFSTRTTIPYTATILVRFSTELQGFLRWGGGYNGDSTNFHVHHRGSEGRPTFNYRFGNADTPFYTALKQQSDTNSQPWMWNDMKNRYPDAQYLIDDLCDENTYVFTLTGQFEDVQGKHVDIYWDTSKPINKRSADRENQENEGNGEVTYIKYVAQAGPDDLPAPRPAPPEVNIEDKKRPVSFPAVFQGD